MRILNDRLLHSPSDLVRFLGCTHATALYLQKLKQPDTLPDPAADDIMAKLAQKTGLEHETAYRNELEQRGDFVEISGAGSLCERVDATVQAMKSGAQTIFQAAFQHEAWHGFADFLVRVETRSELGEWSYEPVDTKLARSLKPSHLVQLGIYAEMITAVQGAPVRLVHVAAGSGERMSKRVTLFDRTVAVAKARYEKFIGADTKGSRAEPCPACSLCGWREHCQKEWDKEDHLSRVSRLTRSQAVRLRAAGIHTVTALAEPPEGFSQNSLAPETFSRLQAQASLQKARWSGGNPVAEMLPQQAGRGLALLPEPDPADMFFDLEGDPFQEGGLDYLWGVHWRNAQGPQFMHHLAHNHIAERKAFEHTVDLFVAHIDKHPRAHIYHYASYEKTALRRLASKYASREEALDRLQRDRRLVDLYTVARQAIRTSEPDLSLKSLEVFFADKRAGAVRQADQSIVGYRDFRETGDQDTLQAVIDYNRVDCENTEGLRDWLVSKKPDGHSWRSVGPVSEDPDANEAAGRDTETAALVEAVMAGSCPPSCAGRKLAGHLLRFHRRADKPAFWAMFDRCEQEPEELIDDADCIGDIRPDHKANGGWLGKEKRSTTAHYTFNPQNTKLRKDNTVLHAPTLRKLGTIVSLDTDAGHLTLKRQLQEGETFPESGSLIPEPTVDNKVLVSAIHRVATAWSKNPDNVAPPYRALVDLIERHPPRLSGWSGGSLVPDGEDPLKAATQRCLALDESILFLQGPPGTGKTHTSARIIVALLQAGKRVGVSSNSHKAINNLLHRVEKIANEQKLDFTGMKKVTSRNPESQLRGGRITDVTRNSELIASRPDLAGGTAWLFADPEMDQQLDYLFVDEAGQVSLGNLLAMGAAARNIILVGDQMQLGQPIQGVHPGESGLSVLEYLLQGEATVATERGILLDTSWRMHPSICGFISAAVYDGRLRSHPDCARQSLHLKGGPASMLPDHGLRFIEMDHTACAQYSSQEVALVKKLTGELLDQDFTDRKGRRGRIGWDNILIIAPYNVQVNALKKALPDCARVGTVDRFQGQEAEIVIFSMTTSTPEDLPRHIDFFYSQNRLNVAVSRARSLAIVLANPKLLELSPRTVEHLELVNMLAWVAQAGRYQP